MKKALAIIAALAIFAAYADDTPATTNVVLQTQFEDGSTNTWTQADLVDALGLMNRKYHRDMQTEQGRREWHGNKLGQYLVTNAVGRIQIVRLYADGFSHTSDAVVRPAAIADPEAAAKAKKKAEETLAAWEAAHLPPEIAALRAAQRAAAQTNTVTVTIEAH